MTSCVTGRTCGSGELFLGRCTAAEGTRKPGKLCSVLTACEIPMSLWVTKTEGDGIGFVLYVGRNDEERLDSPLLHTLTCHEDRQRNGHEVLASLCKPMLRLHLWCNSHVR